MPLPRTVTWTDHQPFDGSFTLSPPKAVNSPPTAVIAPAPKAPIAPPALEVQADAPPGAPVVEPVRVPRIPKKPEVVPPATLAQRIRTKVQHVTGSIGKGIQAVQKAGVLRETLLLPITSVLGNLKGELRELGLAAQVWRETPLLPSDEGGLPPGEGEATEANADEMAELEALISALTAGKAVNELPSNLQDRIMVPPPQADDSRLDTVGKLGVAEVKEVAGLAEACIGLANQVEAAENAIRRAVGLSPQPGLVNRTLKRMPNVRRLPRRALIRLFAARLETMGKVDAVIGSILSSPLGVAGLMGASTALLGPFGVVAVTVIPILTGLLKHVTFVRLKISTTLLVLDGMEKADALVRRQRVLDQTLRLAGVGADLRARRMDALARQGIDFRLQQSAEQLMATAVQTAVQGGVHWAVSAAKVAHRAGAALPSENAIPHTPTADEPLPSEGRKAKIHSVLAFLAQELERDRMGYAVGHTQVDGQMHPTVIFGKVPAPMEAKPSEPPTQATPRVVEVE